ncbi:hypothetical protein CROQUDRAFT_722983 [Cronartium quercuum f. sp. fusiforme G11]|uniref:Wax synthase domain-containing protein n=1 Tax=Cronartium quercuum f. sp. fusiforme G11 TaxID=708437 RepID=A0A9P6TD49_9BASI|nr:hypothetical protein CROQUDRAFT_722983 [Cronartium quercuum f. sp. fusiforme G11]
MSTQLGLSRGFGAYLFTVPLTLQVFLRHPFYRSNKVASLLRMALMPVTIYLTLSSERARMLKPREEFLHINLLLVSFLNIHVVCSAIQLGFSKNPPLSTKDWTYQPNEGQEKSPDQWGVSPTPKLIPKPSWGDLIRFGIWFLSSPRYVQTTWAPPTLVVALGPKLCFKDFFLLRLRKALKDHLLFLACWIIAVKLAKHPHGCYGFLSEQCGLGESHLLALLAPYVNALPHTLGTWLLIENMCNVMTFVELAVYRFGPQVLPHALSPGPFDSTLYPPLFPSLWGQSSIRGFWSKGWHSAFRRHITFCVASPVTQLCAPLGRKPSTLIGTLSAMLFSAFFHEYALVSLAPSGDPTYSTAKVWIYSAVAMLLEEIYTMVSGRKVGGWLGKIWTYSLVVLLASHAITKWINFGLGTSGIQPLAHWRWYRYVIPFGPALPERWISSLP